MILYLKNIKIMHSSAIGSADVIVTSNPIGS